MFLRVRSEITELVDLENREDRNEGPTYAAQTPSYVRPPSLSLVSIEVAGQYPKKKMNAMFALTLRMYNSRASAKSHPVKINSE